MQRIKFLYLILFIITIFSCSKDDEQPVKEIIVDNTPPTLSFSIANAESTSNEPIKVSETIVINIEASDASGIEKVEAYIDNEKAGEDFTPPFNINIDLSTFVSTTGKSKTDLNSVLKVIAIDKEGNETKLVQDIIIITRAVLLSINIPESFLNTFFQNISVFASDMDGNYLENTSIPITNETRNIKIFAPENFDITQEFMITFMTLNIATSTGNNWSYASTFQNLTIDNLKEINFNIPERLEVIEDKILPAVGFGNSIFPHGDGFDYRTSLYSDEEEWLCETLQPQKEMDRVSDKIYLSYTLNQNSSDYYYLFIDRPLPNDFQLNASNFVNDNSATKNIGFTNIQQQPEIATSLNIYGYENELSFQKDIYHNIWSLGTQNFTLPIRYSYNNSFYKYKYNLRIQNFQTSDLGLPKDQYTVPNWTLDPILQNNKIILNKTGEGHTVGRASFREDQSNEIYQWHILFNSENSDEIIIPKIPEQYQNSPLTILYDSNNFSSQQIEISKFEGILNYENYLNMVIKENRNVNHIHNKKETVFYSTPSVYFNYSDFIFD